MRLSLTVVDPSTHDRRDVVLDADPATPLADVVTALAGTVRHVPAASSRIQQSPDVPDQADGGSGGHVVSLALRRAAKLAGAPAGGSGIRGYVGGRLLDPTAPLAGSPLQDGAVLSLDDPAGCIVPEPVGSVDVRVTGGPGAGVVHRLLAGEWTIGSSRACGVPLEDPDLGPVAACLTVHADGTCLIRSEDGEQVLLEREPVTAETAWPEGAQVRIGAVLLEISAPSVADAALAPSQDGAGWDYNRPPRLLPPQRKTMFRLPKEPSKPSKRGLPVVMMLAPLLMCIPMALYFHKAFYLMFGLLSPVTMLGNYVYERRNGKKQYQESMAAWREATATIETEAREALELERVERRAECPDPGALLLTAVGPRARLWERRRHDGDHLVVRFGTADQPSAVQLEDPARPEHRKVVTWDALDVPVIANLREAGVVGIAGGGVLPRRLAAWCVGQLAVLQSPRDVQIWVLTEPHAEADWGWLRWLPHAQPSDGVDVTTLIGTDTESVARRVGELGAVLAARKAAAGTKIGSSRKPVFREADIVVVLDGARRLRSLPGVIALLTEGPALGIHAICLDGDERLLPEECNVVVAERPDGLRVTRQRADAVEHARPDVVPPSWCERVARAMAPIRDVSDDGDGGALPSSSRLLDVIGLEPPTGGAVAARWALGGRTTEAVIGESIDGPFSFDLRRDGPHGLVAGTTGAGKSELLQSIVATLAAANRPDAMTFVLVDYKGGSAFKDCVRLPHTVGMVTDLDTHLVERALTSLGAELKRREHLLAAAGAKDIEDYTDLLDRDGGLTPIPRLLIVIDEFASMARELPDFVTGLVNIAQRGRSLGIHLLLATQRPSGVVSPEIRANTNLRIALRVTDGPESSDVIDAPDAAQISKSTPGRGYIRLGASTLVPFQTGRVGGRRPAATRAADAATVLDPPWVAPVTWADLPRPEPRKPRQEAREEVDDTDLAALVEAIGDAATTLGVPAQHSPWLPALTTSLTLADLPEPAAGAGDLPAVPWGLQDLPAEQAQHPAVIDLALFGHSFVVGGARSGRSQALRTMAAALATHLSTADVHLYGLDCGNGALLPLAKLPHCGAVVQRTQPERAQRLLGRLAAEVARRQEELATGSWADITEQRRAVEPERRLPHVVLLLDRWEGFLGSLAELDGGSLNDTVMTLIREGASVGVHIVLAGDRQLLSGRISTLTEDKLVLRLPDRTDYTLAGLSARKLPDEIPAGRAFRAESAIETQIALVTADPAGAAQAAALEELGVRARARDEAVPRSLRPFRVDVLPSRIGFQDAWELREERATRPLWGLVGVGGDELVARGADLTGGAATFVIGGPPRSGRSAALQAVARSLLLGGTELVVATPRISPLRELDGVPGVRAVLTGEDLTVAELEPLMAGSGVVLLVDDAELLRDCEAKDHLRDLVRTASDTRRGVVVAGGLTELAAGFSGWLVDVRKNRRGALLSPQQITDGELVGVRLPRSTVGAPMVPGRALYHDGSGDLVTIQVPFGD